MKEDEEVEEELLTFSEQFCWDMQTEITPGFRYMRESFENNIQRCNDNDKLDSINCKKTKVRNKLEGNVYDAWFPNDLITTELKRYLYTYYDSLSMSCALLIEYCSSIEYGKHNYNNKTRILTVCPLIHYPEGTEDFSFSSLDYFKPLIKYIVWSKMIIYLNELKAEIKMKKKADQLLHDLPKPCRNDETEISKNLLASPINKNIPKILAFTYRGCYLPYVLKALKKSGAISEEVIQEQFNDLFRGKDVINPIKWHKEQGDLKDFIQTAISTGKLTYPPQQHWNIAIKCFVKPDGSAFKVSSLKSSESTESSDKYIKAANEL